MAATLAGKMRTTRTHAASSLSTSSTSSSRSRFYRRRHRNGGVVTAATRATPSASEGDAVKIESGLEAMNKALKDSKTSASANAKTGSSSDSTNSGGGKRKGQQRTKSEDFSKAEVLFASGEPIELQCVGSNSGGLLLSMGKETCFMPASELAPGRLAKIGRSQEAFSETLATLVAQTFRIRFVDVSWDASKPYKSTLIGSERKAVLGDRVVAMNPGDVVAGTVSKLVPFGAFVELDTKTGSPPLNALCHVSEVSYDTVAHPSEVLSVGERVEAVVVSADARRLRVNISVRALREMDPLQETLISVLEDEQACDAATEVCEAFPGLESLEAALLSVEGIDGSERGRSGIERRTVSQSLELWVGKTPMNENGEGKTEGYKLLARAGNKVQELNVVTQLGKDEFKATVAKVAKTLNENASVEDNV